MPPEIDQELPRQIRRWISLADILSLLVTLSVFAFGYGRLSRDVETLTQAMIDLQAQSRSITPGAAAAIEGMRARDVAMQAQIDQMRLDAQEYRADVRSRLTRIEDKLDDHTNRH